MGRATLIDTVSIRTSLKASNAVDPVRLGVVGLGHRSVLNVIPKTFMYDDYELVCVCDIREDITKDVVSELKEKYGADVRGYIEFEDMIKKEELDAVAILIDPDKQADLIVKAMDAGLHVMAEVPAAYTIEDCFRIVAASERSQKTFLLMEQIRYTGYVQAWKNIVAGGVIGKPLFAEGEYFSDKPDAFYQDDRGVFYSLEQAKGNKGAKPTWRHRAPTITYLPHELSPLLYMLDDRVVRVTAMSVRNESYRYENLFRSDMQAALMHTQKDVILRVAVSHSTPAIPRGELHSHWHHIKGTKGALEWKRSSRENCKLWVDDWQLTEPIEVPWSLKRTDAPREAYGSGHGDADYYVFAVFADAVKRGVKPYFDVYKAVESAAPAILAAESIKNSSMPFDVPDFRPGADREKGRMPKP